MLNKIPHIIHYCWFGNNPKPELVSNCIATWKRYFPDWKIIEWNEGNYDVNKIPYTADAYRLKKWAFVSDYARFDILYQYGGIYLDVDVEFIKPLPEDILEFEGFCGFEGSGAIGPGLIFGIKAQNELLKKVMDTYGTERFEYKKDGIYKTVNTRLTELLMERGLIQNNQVQTVAGIKVFPSEYFCAYDTDVREPQITDNTICWHHYYGSWQNPSMKTKMQNQLKKMIGVDHYKKVLQIVRRMRGR